MTVTARPDVLLPGTIDAYVVRAVPVCAPEDLVGQVRAGLSGRQFEAVGNVAVCRGPAGARVLVGLISAERLFAGEARASAEEVMDPDPPVVVHSADEERAAWKAVGHGESSLAVVDATGHFRGLVPPARLLGVLLRAHDEDFARLGGYLASTASARLAADEPIRRRLWHRFPWLLVGLLGAAASAWLVGRFEGRLTADVRLAYFIPGVVYMADAIGTQTEALMIRGLSVGTSVRRMLRLELMTGPLIGALLGVVTLPPVWWALGSLEVAVAVALALFASCGVATAVAVVLPWLMTTRGKDPAFGSGPLATVVQDLLSLVIYLGIAVAVTG